VRARLEVGERAADEHAPEIAQVAAVHAERALEQAESDLRDDQAREDARQPDDELADHCPRAMLAGVAAR
jgi:hypothetical protein